MELIKPNASKEYVIQTLNWCVSVGESDILQTLLNSHFTNSKISDMTELCSDLLIKVVSKGSCDLLKLLLPYVDDNFLSDENNKMGKSYLSKMLCHAAVNGNKPTVELLMNKGANVNTVYEGKPLLHTAIQTGLTDIAKAFIAQGADIDNALIPAICSPMDEKEVIVDLLLKHGVNPNLVGSNGRQPIHVAAAHSGKIIERLVGIGCDVNAQDPIHGDTPLHIACGMCCKETVESLIKCGAKFNLLNNLGETPLHKLLKFATDYHDFHSQTRLKLAKFLVKLGFILVHTKGQKGNNKRSRGRDKLADVYTSVLTSSKSVFTLQHLCRIDIREHLHSKSPNDSIDSLDIPTDLIKFLKFGDGFCYNTLVSSY